MMSPYTPVTSYAPPLTPTPLIRNCGAPVATTIPVSQKTTAELPDPGSVKKQQTAYAKSLDAQLKRGIEVLNQQLKQQSNYLLELGDQHKKEYSLRVDQRIKQEEIMVAQRYNEQLLMLEQAAQQQRSVLDFQANTLLAEYNQKKAQEDLASQQSQLQQQHYEVQRRYNEEMSVLLAQQATMAKR